ncbi:transposase [Candidatus Sarmatiella mevalonica]|uniref:transposase n=1 Tax=Candidatus Sarmatiella mevalonica TaxID=2770581 RepID=UPI0019212526
MENVLIKELKSCQVVIMDNASFHKSKKIKELIESVNYRIIFFASIFTSSEFNREILG